MPGKIRRDHPMGLEKERRDVIPPTRVRSTTVDEDHRRLIGITPDAQMYAATVDVHVDVVRPVIQCCGEPGWRDRHLARTGKQFSTSEDSNTLS
ncbi:hypothetical protein [Mycobacterium sp. 1245499.0]|uniref:hypothetical protein n=1 Tax=Mycobacterium sp. 1245499.0 TaxID=1834074 RepID=UPI001E3E2C76|nr:hypothetical protein [Mycobacterium sp. 1245499.0]